MATLTDEQLEQICDRCHYTYTVDDDDEMHKICGECPVGKSEE